MKDIKIENITIGHSHSPFIIAELSGNHNQSLDKALVLIDEAARAGAHAIKLQTYTADTLTIDVSHGDFLITDSKSLWSGKNLYELYKQAYTPWEWHKALFDHARKKKILCFSTPFDETAVDFLESLNTPAYKISSFENNHIPLLKKVAHTGKPILLSTGISTLSDIEFAVETLRNNGCNDLVLLKCTSSYPSNAEQTNLLTIPHMAEMFKCYVGLSDHTLGIGVAIASIALGVRVIEKHFTISRADGGVDADFSLEPSELSMLVKEASRAFSSLGHVTYGILKEEESSSKFKRSIYIVENMNTGDVFSEKNLKIIRPGFGISPKYFDMVLGKRINRSAKRGTPLSFDFIA